MSCRSTKGRYLVNKTRCVITLITEYLTWLVKTKAKGKEKAIYRRMMAHDSCWAWSPFERELASEAASRHTERGSHLNRNVLFWQKTNSSNTMEGSGASSATGRCVKHLGTIHMGTMGENLPAPQARFPSFHFLDISITLNWETLGNTNSCHLC